MKARDSKASGRATLPRTMRLTGAKQFQALRGCGVSHVVGPLRVFARPNNLPHSRVGLAVPRRAGTPLRGRGASSAVQSHLGTPTAVVRNRIKRLLREAFRLQQHDLPVGYDVLITARPHEPLSLAEYQRALAKAARALHTIWKKREAT